MSTAATTNTGGAGGAVVAAAQPQSPQFVVLYVDDEEQALKYFKKAFGGAFPVLTATSVDEALTVLEAEHGRVGVLLSDHRMPGRTGIELLAKVKETWPHIMRIMVTAYADTESAIAAVNSGSVYKYLTKPVDLGQTKQVLADAMRSFADGRAREAAASDRGELVQRMIVVDRVRSLATMATGVSHHVRNSLTAVNCFFEEIGEKVTAARESGDTEYLDQLLSLAQQERVRLVGMIRDVEARGARKSFQFSGTFDVAELVARAVASAVAGAGGGADAGPPVMAEVPAGLAAVRGDAEAVVRMLGTLIVHAQRYSPKGAAVRITADGPITYWDTSAVRLRVMGDGPAWQDSDVASFFTPFAITTKTPNDVGLDLLDAFQTVLGHEGDIVAHAGPPSGPGFEVRLPLDPTAVRRPALVDGRFEAPPAPIAAVA